MKKLIAIFMVCLMLMTSMGVSPAFASEEAENCQEGSVIEDFENFVERALKAFFVRFPFLAQICLGEDFEEPEEVLPPAGEDSEDEGLSCSMEPSLDEPESHPEEEVPSDRPVEDEPIPGEPSVKEPSPEEPSIIEPTPDEDLPLPPTEEPMPDLPLEEEQPVLPSPEKPEEQPSVNIPEEDEEENNAVLAYEKEVVRLVNVERQKNGLAPLTYSEELSLGAREKSADMQKMGYFSHTSPTYGSPFDQMRSYGISYRYAGENIAMGYATPKQVVDAWMNSDGHRANILSANFTEIGVGYVEDGHYCTQWFKG